MKAIKIVSLLVVCLVVVISYLKIKPKKIKDIFEHCENLEMFI